MSRLTVSRRAFVSGLGLACMVAASLGVGCDPAHRYPPDELCATGPWVYHRELSCGAASLPPACSQIDAIARAGLRLCPGKRDKLLSDLGSLRVDLYGYPVPCGGRLAHGCQHGSHITAENARAAQDEVGHVVWERCHGNSGEYFDGGYSRAFASWLGTARSIR